MLFIYICCFFISHTQRRFRIEVFYLILFKRAQHKYSGYSWIIALNTIGVVSTGVWRTTLRQEAVLFFGHMDEGVAVSTYLFTRSKTEAQ